VLTLCGLSADIVAKLENWQTSSMVSSNVTTEWLALLLQEILGLRTIIATSFVVFIIPFRKMLGECLKMGHYHFLPILPNSPFTTNFPFKTTQPIQLRNNT
jgi:hypothetical protein